jgi:bacteriocin resistance YdeI/OmpD-like protein
MSASLRKKFRLQPGMKVLTIAAPANHLKDLNADDGDITAGSKLKEFDQVHWFVNSKKEVEAGAGIIKKLVTGDILCWVFFPKGTSRLQTDLTRDAGWEALLQGQKFQWLKLVSFDEKWSAFSIRKAKEVVAGKPAARRKADAVATKAAPVAKVREILDYIDPVKRTVRVPDDLQSALNGDKKAAGIFEKLAFSHRKEYVEWIVTAKKEETRKARINGTLEKLNQGWKNPHNL